MGNYLQSYVEQWGFSGVVCIYKEGDIVLHKENGFACMEFGIKNSLETCFSLGSISKQFTAFAVMQLVDKGLIQLDESAVIYLPDNLSIDARITVHQLLSHTSGLHNFYNFDDDFFGAYNRNTYARQEYFDLFIDRALLFEPGTHYNYNNANYNLLAWIVESMSRMSFGDYLRENIFLPLGMKNTVLDTGTNIIPGKAFPYDYDSSGIVRCQYYNEKFSVGAGAVVSNSADLVRWYRCLRERKLLTESTYATFFSVNQNQYCYGLEKRVIHDRACYTHGGDHLGVMTYAGHFFEENLFICILSNAGFGNQYKMAASICDLLFTGKTSPPMTLPTVELSDEQAKKCEGVYLDRKIELRRHNGNWAFVRFNGELHIPVRPVGNHRFARIDADQYEPYALKECKDGSFEFFGYKKKD